MAMNENRIGDDAKQKKNYIIVVVKKIGMYRARLARGKFEVKMEKMMST